MVALQLDTFKGDFCSDLTPRILRLQHGDPIVGNPRFSSVDHVRFSSIIIALDLPLNVAVLRLFEQLS
jgi:hypothetical protein